MGLRLTKLFQNEDMIEEYFALLDSTDFTFKKHELVVQINEKWPADKNLDYERRTQKELEKLRYNFIKINPDKIDFNDYEDFGRVVVTLLIKK